MNDQTTRRIDGYHAHVYYDRATRPVAERLAAAIAGGFPARIGGFADGPAGPHPVANLQIVFDPAAFAVVVPWLMLNRGGLTVLVHPLTDDPARDHDADGMWLGTQLKLRPHRHDRDYAPALPPSA